jgi:hypothetical protein
MPALAWQDEEICGLVRRPLQRGNRNWISKCSFAGLPMRLHVRAPFVMPLALSTTPVQASRR